MVQELSKYQKQYRNNTDAAPFFISHRVQTAGGQMTLMVLTIFIVLYFLSPSEITLSYPTYRES